MIWLTTAFFDIGVIKKRDPTTSNNTPNWYHSKKEMEKLDNKTKQK